jgi:3-hydroxy-9,10-secoandrosta-1,3,5(10)-triene-9,17-dione monooxygenase reductase component
MSAHSFSQRSLREALSSFATGVTIVTTTDDDGAPVGMTASSFNSVSMDPPLILWSVTKAALSAPAFKACSHFNVHVLAADQVELSNRFAMSGSDKFAGIDYTTSAHGMPVLPGAVARFECSNWSVYEGGDHWILIGEVLALHHDKAEGLVFSEGSYATASPITKPSVDNKSEAAADAEIDNLLFYNLSRSYRLMADQFHSVVRASGLSVPQWRILASLRGKATHSLHELAVRTFIEDWSLLDTVLTMQDEGLCTTNAGTGVADTDVTIRGTRLGHERVEHLFALSSQQEREALGDDEPESLAQLIELLQRLVETGDARH